ncbi:uncharacterized protein J7T54_004222 [Emericellopsis cladophorae]|uniref:Uncharacterized protein n=1 Tax=Emericellopsis cladophorae TaxID=2686198 RepID=A0A9P9XZ31_9HYPO|nr:uncharacterized protein J7T54_004222 [Emericellopsis cladophorae]KAI6780090.1 hypothetical protein J7T54_004222 [Emericellopsis cladophorae]
MGLVERLSTKYPDEKSEGHLTSDGQGPPPYSPASSADLSAPSSLSSAPGTTLKLPQSFWLDYRWHSSTSFIGAEKGERDFAVTVPSRMNCFAHRAITLRDGSAKDSPALVSVKGQKGSLGRRSVISLPSMGEEDPGQDIVGAFGPGGSSKGFDVTLENGTVEHFEWRRSMGDEVKNLASGCQGWKLVRMDSPYTLAGGKEDFPPGYTSDGREVVAAAAYPKMFRNSPRFEFLGSGARGEMGVRFELVAAISFVRMYEIAMEQASAGSASS